MYYNKSIEGIGKRGEKFTAEYLRKNGYIIIRTNYSNRYGEVDIIAENEDYIVFVEVKTRKSDALVSGADSVDIKKVNRIFNLANDFLNKFYTDKPPRFDFAEVIYNNEIKPDFKLNYIESAF